MIKVKSLNIDAFNVHGLYKGLKYQQLSRDLERQKVNISCIQETNIRKIDIVIRKDCCNMLYIMVWAL